MRLLFCIQNIVLISISATFSFGYNQCGFYFVYIKNGIGYNQCDSYFVCKKNIIFEGFCDRVLKIRLRRSIQRVEIYKSVKIPSKTASKRVRYGHLKLTPLKICKNRQKKKEIQVRKTPWLIIWSFPRMLSRVQPGISIPN